MLTIKHVYDTGHESIIQAESVSSIPGNQVKGGERVIIAYGVANGIPHEFKSGDVFVMNDSGQTVAAYRGLDGNELS